jgi:tetratricopeptide (TPR) repeat protein
MRRRFNITVVVLWLAAAAGDGQPSHCDMGMPSYVDPVILERPTTLKDGIGRVSQKVTTKSSEVQSFYDQGLAYLHSYVWIEAARSFHQALHLDPDCAMAWMGLARAEQGLERHAAAKLAIEKATVASAHASEREKCFITLRAQQIDAVAASTPVEERKRHEAYKRSLSEALAASPDDAELWILRGNAEEPGPWGRGQFGGVESIAYYQTALVHARDHFAAQHYLVHSYENIGQAAKSAEYGKLYAAAAPAIAHAQHMYGHVLPRVGRWEEALAQFQKADALEERYAREESLRPGDDSHHAHNLQLLGYAYLRLGRLGEAEKTFRRLEATPIRDPIREWQHASLAEFLLLTGRAAEALSVSRRMEAGSVSARAAGAAVGAEALLALGRLPEARAAAERASAAHAEKAKLASQDALRFEGTVGPFVAQAHAELALSGTDPSDGEKALRELADGLAANPHFDAWGEGLFRIERMAQAAQRAGRAELARQLQERARRIDPAYTPRAWIATGQARGASR